VTNPKEALTRTGAQATEKPGILRNVDLKQEDRENDNAEPRTPMI
jgi:hypothetical protein